MVPLLKDIFYFIVWVFVPATLVIQALLLKLRIDKVEEKRHRAAMQAGYWAGIMLFIIVLIYQVAIFLKTGFPREEIFQGFSLILALGSAFVVFVFLGGKKIVPAVISGLLVLIFNFLIFTAFLHYLFIRTHNDVLLSMILGGIFGFLTHFAVSPTSFKEFLKGKSF